MTSINISSNALFKVESDAVEVETPVGESSFEIRRNESVGSLGSFSGSGPSAHE